MTTALWGKLADCLKAALKPEELLNHLQMHTAQACVQPARKLDFFILASKERGRERDMKKKSHVIFR